MASKCWKKFKKFWSKETFLPKKFAFGCTLAQGMMIVAILLILLGILFIILLIYYFVVYDYYTEDNWDYCVEEREDGENSTDDPVPLPTVPMRIFKREFVFDEFLNLPQMRKHEPSTDKEKADYRDRKIPDGSPVAYTLTILLVIGLLLDIFLLVALIMHWTEYVKWWMYFLIGRAIAFVLLAIVIIIRCRKNTRRLCWLLEILAFFWLAAFGLFIYIALVTYSLYLYMKQRKDLDNKMVKPRRMSKRSKQDAKEERERQKYIEKMNRDAERYRSRRPSQQGKHRLSDHGSRRTSKRWSVKKERERMKGSGDKGPAAGSKPRDDKAVPGGKTSTRGTGTPDQPREGDARPKVKSKGPHGSGAPSDTGEKTPDRKSRPDSGISGQRQTQPENAYDRGTTEGYPPEPTYESFRGVPDTSSGYPSEYRPIDPNPSGQYPRQYRTYDPNDPSQYRSWDPNDPTQDRSRDPYPSQYDSSYPRDTRAKFSDDDRIRQYEPYGTSDTRQGPPGASEDRRSRPDSSRPERRTERDQQAKDSSIRPTEGSASGAREGHPDANDRISRPDTSRPERRTERDQEVKDSSIRPPTDVSASDTRGSPPIVNDDRISRPDSSRPERSAEQDQQAKDSSTRPPTDGSASAQSAGSSSPSERPVSRKRSKRRRPGHTSSEEELSEREMEDMRRHQLIEENKREEAKRRERAAVERRKRDSLARREREAKRQKEEEERWRRWEEDRKQSEKEKLIREEDAKKHQRELQKKQDEERRRRVEERMRREDAERRRQSLRDPVKLRDMQRESMHKKRGT